MLQPCLPNFSTILTLPLENTGDMANAKYIQKHTLNCKKIGTWIACSMNDETQQLYGKCSHTVSYSIQSFNIPLPRQAMGIYLCPWGEEFEPFQAGVGNWKGGAKSFKQNTSFRMAGAFEYNFFPRSGGGGGIWTNQSSKVQLPGGFWSL